MYCYEKWSKEELEKELKFWQEYICYSNDSKIRAIIYHINKELKNKEK